MGRAFEGVFAKTSEQPLESPWLAFPAPLQRQDGTLNLSSAAGDAALPPSAEQPCACTCACSGLHSGGNPCGGSEAQRKETGKPQSRSLCLQEAASQQHRPRDREGRCTRPQSPCSKVPPLQPPCPPTAATSPTSPARQPGRHASSTVPWCLRAVQRAGNAEVLPSCPAPVPLRRPVLLQAHPTLPASPARVWGWQRPPRPRMES